MRRILFLDFDGVLNSGADGYAHALSSVPIGYLNSVVRRTGARVVVSSSWRYGTPVSYLRRTLRLCGFLGRVIGKTPEAPTARPGALYVGRLRGDEIQEWLNGYAKRYLIESFAIVDDESDMAHLAHRHVRTDARVGLTAEDADRLVELLTPRRQDEP